MCEQGLTLATIKGHSEMCSFITQHNATDVASFEGACNWHADCRNVHQSCCPWIECSLLYHKLSPKAFLTICHYIQPASQPQIMCNHTSPGAPHPACGSSKIILRPATQTAAATIGPHNQRISAQTVRNRLREAHLHARQGLYLTAVCRCYWLEWANAHIRWHLARWRGALFMDEQSWTVFTVQGWWQTVCVASFIHNHQLMLQHDNSPMLQGSTDNSWKLKTSQFLHGQHSHRTCHPLSMFGMVWIRHVYDTYTTACSSSCRYPATWHSHWRGVDQHYTGHNQQPDQLYAKEMCVGQMVVTSDTDWFSDPPQTPPIEQNCTFQSGLVLWPATPVQ